MKCRRNKNSPGARLRRSSHGTPVPVDSANAAKEITPPAAMQVGSESVLRIDGHTKGPIHYAGAVSVGPNGQVSGNLSAVEIFVEGAINGNVRASRSLRIAASAKIVGDMESPRVSVARGAQLRGSIATRGGLGPASDLDDCAVDAMLSGGRRA
jgi:predicted acyltransferase (DUF342 family)